MKSEQVALYFPAFSFSFPRGTRGEMRFSFRARAARNSWGTWGEREHKTKAISGIFCTPAPLVWVLCWTLTCVRGDCRNEWLEKNASTAAGEEKQKGCTTLQFVSIRAARLLGVVFLSLWYTWRVSLSLQQCERAPVNRLGGDGGGGGTKQRQVTTVLIDWRAEGRKMCRVTTRKRPHLDPRADLPP